MRIGSIKLNALLIAVSLASVHGSTRADDTSRRTHLIEFGWDEPDTGFMRRHIAEMEATPFDGCVFHANAINARGEAEAFTWQCWGRRAFTEAEMRPAIDDLKATTFRTFTRNFLRFNTAPGELDWFDDHAAIVANARLAARIAREGKAVGILFDVEEYGPPLFTYKKQRDAKTKSWDAYAAQARRRGFEVMTAFQEGYPDLTVLLTFGPSFSQTLAKEGKTALADTRYGLLAPFVDGLIDAARGSTRIVDGFELSYGYKERSQFDGARTLMKEGVLPIVADPAKYRRVVSSGFGLWLDHDWRTHGWDVVDTSKNHFTPDSFATSLRLALERTDDYVWIYTETPRWWSEAGGRVKLRDSYVDAIRRTFGEFGTRPIADRGRSPGK